jgi:hypothetical protein
VNVNDTCPRCLRRDVPPFLDREDYHGNPHSTYACPGCGWTWTTQRIAEPEPDQYAVYDDPDAWEADDDFTAYDRRFHDADQAEAEEWRFRETSAAAPWWQQ